MRWARNVIAMAVLVACSSSPKPTPKPAPAQPGQPAQHEPEPPPYDVAPIAEDPPEPTAPQAECAFARSVFCVTGQPTRTALQPSPFEWCTRTQPPRQQSVVPYDAQFSAGETRAHRATEPAACCYVEFSTMACD
jgi:hypothetical protein